MSYGALQKLRYRFLLHGKRASGGAGAETAEKLRPRWTSHTPLFRHVITLQAIPTRGEPGQVRRGRSLIGLAGAWLPP